MDAHLLFDRAAGDAVRPAERAVVLDLELGHHEQRNALGAGRRAFDAREHQMHDVLGEVVLAGGDENLGAGDLVAAVGLFHRLGAQQAEIRAAMRLGEIHGAGPGAFHHLGQIFRLQLRRSMREQRGNGALGEARIHGEGHVGRAEHLVHSHRQGRRQVLAAVFGRHRDADPASLDDLLEGVLEAGRCGDAAVGVARAAFLVADAIKRGEDFLAELGRLAQHRFDHVGRSLAESREIAVTIEMEDVVQQKQRIVHRGFVGRHRSLPASGEHR